MELPFITFGKQNLPPLLFIHGILGSKEDWNSICRNFSSSHFCLCIDLPGHGSALFEDNKFYQLDECTTSIIKLLRKLNLKKVVGVGYSLGGRILLNTAFKDPTLFQGLILESSSPGLKTLEELQERRKQEEEWAYRLENDTLCKFVDAWYEQPLFHSLRESPSKLAELKLQRLQNSGKHLAKAFRYLGSGATRGLWQVWPTIKTPVHLFVGEKDEKFMKIAQDMYDQQRNCTISVIANAGHNIHFEKPECFVQELKNIFCPLLSTFVHYRPLSSNQKKELPCEDQPL
jgi:2-succinyl-6-hydroxy-2,4-cyclohexadiene-1-carboxylate synthase